MQEIVLAQEEAQVLQLVLDELAFLVSGPVL
jgi:hypothetical protein